VVVSLRHLLVAGAHVLDLGSGDGRDALYLLKAGCRVVAWDMSSAAIEALKRSADAQGSAEALTAVVQDVTSAAWPVETFDAVIGMTVLDHIEERLHREVIDGISSAVRPGGYVALEMHSDRDPGVAGTSEARSEFVSAICSVAHRHSLIRPFLSGWRILAYSDRLEHDSDHGEPHDHGFCTILARKESDGEQEHWVCC
jgi:2-polyprenyl-3-methyl-5-hydroxy-6-metoxy-1,4-benzoquinol methylase